MRKRLVIVGASAVGVIALAIGGTALAQGSGAEGAEDRDERISGSGADRAGAAALESLGSGRVTGVERDSDNAYEVEVKQADGSTVDVDVNDSFQVAQDGDGGENDRDDANDDDRDANDDRDDANEADDRDGSPPDDD